MSRWECPPVAAKTSRQEVQYGHIRVPVRRSPREGEGLPEISGARGKGHLVEVPRRPRRPGLPEHVGRFLAAARGAGGPRQPRGPRKDPRQPGVQEGEGDVPRAGDERFGFVAGAGEKKEEKGAGSRRAF